MPEFERPPDPGVSGVDLDIGEPEARADAASFAVPARAATVDALREVSPAEADELMSALRRVSHRSPVRRLAERLIRGESPPAEEFAAALGHVRPGGWWGASERQAASWCMGFVPADSKLAPEAAEALASVLDIRPSRHVGCLACSGCLFPYFIVLLPLLIGGALRDKARNRVRQAAAVSLGRMRRPAGAKALARAVPSCSNGLSAGDKSVRYAAAWALAHLAESLTPEDRAVTAYAVTPALCSLLNDANEADTLMVLNSLALFGTGQAVYYVERLSRTGRTPRIQAEAARLLPTLYERRQRERASATLLRPSASPTGPEELLLRPAGMVETPAQRLLRPSSSQGQDPAEALRHTDSGDSRPADESG